MAANTVPIFIKAPKVSWSTLITTANTAKNGTGTVITIYTADVTNGGIVSYINAVPTGTSVASVLRIFINNGLTNATPDNNILFREVTLPAITISEVASQVPIVIPINIVLPAGYKLNITIGTTVAAGWAVSTVGGDY